MYKELVTLLRKKYNKAPLVMAAADALEELAPSECELGSRIKGAFDYLHVWVSVADGLPEDRSDVLAYLKYEVAGRIAAANYDKGMWQDCVMGGLYRTEEGVITHWMPLPMPPED